MATEQAPPSVLGYRQRFGTLTRIPEHGRSHGDVLAEIGEQAEAEAVRWRDGFASGAVYSGDREHVDFLNAVYALQSQANPLHTDLWPSVVKYESEIVAMTATMLHAEATGFPPGTEQGVAGTLSSGGTESILLAMKAYRDHARATRGITDPEMVAPVTAHAAFDKAAQYFGIRMVHTPVGDASRADVGAVRDAVSDRTIAVIGSAPGFPYGVVDPIEEMSEIARERGIGFHTDACLGGFLLPWAERLGIPVPMFDFRLPGVTSISCDTHKYGYAAKGTSVVLYRNPELRHHQFFTLTDWPGGLYCSPSFAGSRPGALSAACWAAMVTMGEDGYTEAARRIFATTREIREGITSGFPELALIGESLFVVPLRSTQPELDIYRVNDAMSARGWSLNGLHRPAAIHLVVTQRHTRDGVAARFLRDLRAAVDHVRADPEEAGGMAPIYGMADTLPDRGLVADALRTHMDAWYRVD